jgi:hypothetical protein
VVVVEVVVALVAAVVAEAEEILVESGAAVSNDNPTRLIRRRERSTSPLPFLFYSHDSDSYPEGLTMRTAARSSL